MAWVRRWIRVVAASVVLGLTAGVSAALAGPFPAEFDLGSLRPENGGDGTEGFVLAGEGHFASVREHYVSDAGDVNADGIHDVVIGTHNEPTYVVFGTEQGFPPLTELWSLLPENGGDGTLGFAILNTLNEGTGGEPGASVSDAGDINGDGIDDVIVGFSSPYSNGEEGTVASYVVFGTDQGFPASIDVSALDGTNGFIIDGLESGSSVSGAGDVNSDDIDDVIVGTSSADPDGRESAGQSYVVFGTDQGFPVSIDVLSLDGTNGFVLNGIDEGDGSGGSVSAAGDVNGDGIDDLIIGAGGGDPNGQIDAGESYLVFGRDGDFPAAIQLSSLDGANGFVLAGIAAGDQSGGSVSSAGDVNGDGIDDLIIGAWWADPNGQDRAGESYVVFGRTTGFPAEFELSSLLPGNGGDGTNGFILTGAHADDRSGSSVSEAGDVNGDSIDDVIVVASTTERDFYTAGKSYVVYGSKQAFPAIIELSSLDGSVGFALTGEWEELELVSSAAGVGDVNSDGIDDFIVGSWAGECDRKCDGVGLSYVVFGRRSLEASVVGIDAWWGGCVNATDPQKVSVALPDSNDIESWDCWDHGLTVSPGDSVRVYVGGAGQTDVFDGTVISLAADAEALCRNLTQAVGVVAPLSDEGQWSCTEAGLPVAAGDRVRAIVTGTIE